MELRGEDLWSAFAIDSVDGHTPASLSRLLRDDPRADFGRVIARAPELVLAPRTEQATAALLERAGAEGVHVRVRGGGHSSGGQSLSDEVVVDLRHLSTVKLDGERASAGGGALWWAVVEEGLDAGLRPPVLTSNPHTTVAGTLAVGGFGDTSHVHGLQAENVLGMRLALPTGEVASVGPEDELFRLALAGRGEVGVITQVTLPLVRRPMHARVRFARWASLEAFTDATERIVGHGTLDFGRFRLMLRVPGVPTHVVGALGALAPEGADVAEEAFEPLGADELGPLEDVNLDDRDPSFFAWAQPCPALELTLPLPAGVEVIHEMANAFTEAGLAGAMPLGVAIQPLAGSQGTLPLSPLPAVDRCAVLAFRPAVPPDAVPLVLPLFETAARATVEAGGRLYRMSAFDPDDELLAAMWGEDALARLARERDRVDPRRVLSG